MSQTDKPTEPTDTERSIKTPAQADNHALEVCFVVVVGLIVIAAFIEALSYELVSSRTPLVIMVPLIALLGVQLLRLKGTGGLAPAAQRLGAALRGQIPAASKMAAFLGWLAALLATIIAFGHYVGIAGFVFVLTRMLAKERLKPSIIISVAITALIFLVFEIGFDIELYRGLIYRYFAGYRVF